MGLSFLSPLLLWGTALAAAPVLARPLGVDPPAGAAEKVPDELGQAK